MREILLERLKMNQPPPKIVQTPEPATYNVNLIIF